MLANLFAWDPNEIYHFEFWAFLLYHVTLAVLIGLAFRLSDGITTAWMFTGLVLVSWLMTIGALLLIRHESVSRSVAPQSGLFILQCYMWTQMAARPVTAVLYAVVQWLRNGITGLKSFGIALGFSFVIILSWILTRETIWPSVEFESNNTDREAFWMGFTSWDVIMNWIVWYWFLFQTNRQPQLDPPEPQLA